MASWLEEMKKKVWNDYLLDETLSFPHLLTVTYFDTEGIERDCWQSLTFDRFSGP